MTLVVTTKSVDQTRDLAAALAELARAGDVILLAGDLGAGKTAFVQGFGRGLGITDPITSPTFTLAHEYEGRLRVHHVDVYRLENLSEVFDIGLPELLDDDAVVIVEWGDAIVPAIPKDYLEVRIELGDGEDDRTITLRAVGQRWSARQRALTAATQPWAVESGPC
jgi:tRNA threonylcarbamoyladenosine biosynthesis protein TsaE